MNTKPYKVGVYTLNVVKDASLLAEKTPADTPWRVEKLLREFLKNSDGKEHFVALYMNTRNRVIGINEVSVGTLSASLVHPREVFRPAIALGAAAIIVAHNHPSGDCSPSPEDKEVTRRIRDSGALLGIPLLDHIVLADGEIGEFYSFREQGQIKG